jgi:hypothetical protein
MAYSRSLSAEAQQRTNTIIAQAYYSSDSRFRDDYDNIEDGETVEPPQKKTRRRQYVMARRTEDGDLERIKPTESFWCLYYVQNPLLEDDRFVKKFRNRFRLPYTQYRELVEECKESQLSELGKQQSTLNFRLALPLATPHTLGLQRDSNHPITWNKEQT